MPNEPTSEDEYRATEERIERAAAAASQRMPVYAHLPDLVTADGKCLVTNCPGFGETMAVCANPGHEAAWADIDPEHVPSRYFHAQRKGKAGSGNHGPTRRGGPATYCSQPRPCRRWHAEHPEGLRRRWIRVDFQQLAMTFIGPGSRVGHEIWDGTAIIGDQGGDYRVFEHAANGVRAQIASGVIKPREERTPEQEALVRLLLEGYWEPSTPTISLDAPGIEGALPEDEVAESQGRREARERITVSWLSALSPSALAFLGRLNLPTRNRKRPAITYALALRHEDPEAMAAWVALTRSEGEAVQWLAMQRSRLTAADAEAAERARLADLFTTDEVVNPWPTDKDPANTSVRRP